MLLKRIQKEKEKNIDYEIKHMPQEPCHHDALTVTVTHDAISPCGENGGEVNWGHSDLQLNSY